MIRTEQINLNIIKMFVQLNLEFTEVCDFLAYQGYRIVPTRLHLPAQEEMLVSEPEIMKYTFCAIQGDEKPSWENQYLKVFEREAKKTLKVFMKI